MKLVKGAAIVKRLGKTSDRGTDLVLSLNELTQEEAGNLYVAIGENVFFLIGSQPITEANMPDIKDIIDKDAGQKSPSQRLRNILRVYWKENLKKKYKDFDSYYLVAINRIIERFKDKLS